MSQPPEDPTGVPDEEVDAALMAFALRFDGDSYAESRGGGEILGKWTNRFVATLRMADQPNKNHSAFFMLQRYLSKWGGEMLSDESREHLAFRLLFLHLYREKVPRRFSLNLGEDLMRKLDLGRVEAVAARVREQIIARTLRHGDPLRPGVGPRPQEPTGDGSPEG